MQLWQKRLRCLRLLGHTLWHLYNTVATEALFSVNFSVKTNQQILRHFGRNSKAVTTSFPNCSFTLLLPFRVKYCGITTRIELIFTMRSTCAAMCDVTDRWRHRYDVLVVTAALGSSVIGDVAAAVGHTCVTAYL